MKLLEVTKCGDKEKSAWNCAEIEWHDKMKKVERALVEAEDLRVLLQCNMRNLEVQYTQIYIMYVYLNKHVKLRGHGQRT